MKITLISKWTVLLLTACCYACIFFGLLLTVGPLHLHIGSLHVVIGNGLHSFDLGTILILLGLLSNFGAELLALADAVQERRPVWAIGLILLFPTGLGPLLYSLFGPRNTL
jgi:hypothetical protein